MRKKGHAVQRKKRAEDMDTFILNIGVGNDEGGRKEGRKGGSGRFPRGILHISPPGYSDPTNRRRKYSGISEETVRVRWRGKQSG